jgi:hypothetical protein
MWYGRPRSRDGSRKPSRQLQIGPIECLESRELLSVSSHARIINGSSVGIVNGSPTNGFGAVGEVGDRSGPYCTGTLISPRYVLTAGHCGFGVRPTNGRFWIGGNVYATSRVIVHPDYNGSRIGFSDSANDVSIFELAVSVAGITPDAIFRGTPHVGDALTLVGYGAGGTGSTGQDGTFGLKRVGTTPVDGVTQRRVLWTFDNNHESNTAPGDSGGPAYLQVGGVYYIAGITSGGDRADAGIGDHSYDTRVDYYASWIDSIAGTTGVPDPNPNPTPVPQGDEYADAPGPDASALAFAADGTIYAAGSLQFVGDRDVFQIQVSEQGTISLDLVAVDGTLDTYLRVYDASGTLLGFDDDSGLGTDSQLSLSLQPGVYYISAGSFQDAATGSYHLNGSIAQDDHSDTTLGATPVTLNSIEAGSIGGLIGWPGDRDVFQFVASQSGHVSIAMQATSGNLDPMLAAFNNRGRLLAMNDDFAGTLNSHLSIKVKAGAKYYVQASGFQTTEGAYTISISSPRLARLAASLRSATSDVVTVSAPDATPVAPIAGTETPVVIGSRQARERVESLESRVESQSKGAATLGTEQVQPAVARWKSAESRPTTDVLDCVLADVVLARWAMS